MLLAGLPPTALSRTPVEDRVRDRWTLEVELLAQVVEEVSILAAEHRRKKPRVVPRPKRPLSQADKAASYQRGIAVLRATARAA